MNDLFLKPAVEGFIVRFPGNRDRILKQKGEYVRANTFWRRRLRGGDVIKVETPSPKKKKDPVFVESGDLSGDLL